MVEFEEIKDEHYEENDEFVDEEEGSDGDYSDVSSESDYQDDDNIQNETIFDRIAALKDIIPAHQRDAISRTLSKTFSYGSMATFIGGKAIYIIITSILMAGIPYALALEEERMLSEQERQMQLQQGMSEVFYSFSAVSVNPLQVLAPTAAEAIAEGQPEAQHRPVRPPGF